MTAFGMGSVLQRTSVIDIYLRLASRKSKSINWRIKFIWNDPSARDLLSGGIGGEWGGNNFLWGVSWQVSWSDEGLFDKAGFSSFSSVRVFVVDHLGDAILEVGLWVGSKLDSFFLFSSAVGRIFQLVISVCRLFDERYIFFMLLSAVIQVAFAPFPFFYPFAIRSFLILSLLLAISFEWWSV